VSDFFFFLYLSNLAPASEHNQYISVMLVPKSTVEKHETDSSLPSSAKVKNEQICSYVSSLPYAVMVWCLKKERDYFIFVCLWHVVDDIILSCCEQSCIFQFHNTQFDSSSYSFVSMRWFYFHTPVCMFYLFSVIQFCIFVNIFSCVFEILRLL
jgi:hypothetical protein